VKLEGGRIELFAPDAGGLSLLRALATLGLLLLAGDTHASFSWKFSCCITGQVMVANHLIAWQRAALTVSIVSKVASV
jgi:hypothetical protein